MEACVIVPATSANLGPGYDAFGLALALYDVFEAEPAAEWSVEVIGEGEGLLETDGRNEVVRSMQRLFSEVGYSGAAAVRCDNGIPVGRGLGSSAAAIVGGLMLGDLIAGSMLTRERIFELAAELEGHPDNVAAAIFGGFTMCWHEDGVAKVARIEPGAGLAAVAALSDASLPTADARKALPDTVPHSDAAFTAGRDTKSLPRATTTPPSGLSPCRSRRTSSLTGAPSPRWSSRTANTCSPARTSPP